MSSRLETTPSLLPPKSTRISSGSMRTTVPSTTSPCLRLLTSTSGCSRSSAIVIGSALPFPDAPASTGAGAGSSAVDSLASAGSSATAVVVASLMGAAAASASPAGGSSTAMAAGGGGFSAAFGGAPSGKGGVGG